MAYRGKRNVVFFLVFSVENEFVRNFISFAGSNCAELGRESRNRNSISNLDNVSRNEMKTRRILLFVKYSAEMMKFSIFKEVKFNRVYYIFSAYLRFKTNQLRFCYFICVDKKHDFLTNLLV